MGNETKGRYGLTLREWDECDLADALSTALKRWCSRNIGRSWAVSHRHMPAPPPARCCRSLRTVHIT